MKQKKGASLLIEILVVAAALLVLFFVLLAVGINPIAGVRFFSNEKQVTAACIQLYNDNHLVNESQMFQANLCKPNQGQYCKDFNSYCCDMLPNDNIDDKNKQFTGCCIPQNKTDLCPVPPKK